MKIQGCASWPFLGVCTLAEDVIHRLDLPAFLFPDYWDARAQLWLTDPAPTIAAGVQTLQEDVVVSVWDESKGTLSAYRTT